MPSQISYFCDECWSNDEKTEGERHSLSFDGGPEKTFLICKQHLEELIAPAVRVAEEFGEPVEQPVGKPATRVRVSTTGPQHEQTLRSAARGVRKGRAPSGPRENECLWCDLSYSGAASSGFARHLRVAHGFDGIVEAFGGPCPVCGGGPYEQILNHARRAHEDMGFTSVTQPYTWARDNGDPYGVYAAKMEQKPSLDPEEEFKRVRAVERKTNNESGARVNAAEAAG